MNERLRNHVFVAFGLGPNQKEAAIERNRDVVVTAGAGSGKTRTLAARYISLLAENTIDLRFSLSAISCKAAREMRSRVRKYLGDLSVKAETDKERSFWSDIYTRMDSARISTIHSLCADILRAHSVEAVDDPKFEVR